jgi:hypothetical protein
MLNVRGGGRTGLQYKSLLVVPLLLISLFLTTPVSTSLAANPSSPFSPSDRVLDPNCSPLDSNCYVSVTSVSFTNATSTNFNTTNATSTNLYSSMLNALTAYVTSLVVGNSTTTNAIITKATTTNLSVSNIYEKGPQADVRAFGYFE